MKSKFEQSIKPYQLIKETWEHILSLNIKEQYKALRSIGFDIVAAYKHTQEIKHLEFYRDILKVINKTHNVAQFKLALSKIISRWLEVTGNANAKIILKKSGTLTLTSAVVTIGDPDFLQAAQDTYHEYSDNEFLNLINSNRLFIFNTGGDGTINIQLRVINAFEPVLSQKEYKFVFNATEIAIINIPKGKVVASDLNSLLTITENLLLINVEPGNYKIAAYEFFIPGKFTSYYVVLCKTDKETQDNLRLLPSFCE